MKTHLFYIIIILISISCFSDGPEKINPCMDSTATVEVVPLDTSLTVGHESVIRYRIDGMSNDRIDLVASTGINTIHLRSDVQNGMIEFLLPEGFMRTSGYLDLQLFYKSCNIFGHNVRIHSGLPAGLIEAYVSPKSIEVGNNELVEIIAIPTDQFGNLVEDDHEVSLTYAVRGGLPVRKNENVKFGSAQFYIAPSRKAGKVICGIKSHEAVSKSKELHFVAGAPATIRTELVDWYPYADDRNHMVVQSNKISDMYDNIVPDGTHVSFYMEDNTGEIAAYPSITSNGIANAMIKNPDTAGPVKIWAATESGAASNTMIVEFSSFISSIPLEIDEYNIFIGPIIGALDQYVADGTKVNVQLIAEDLIYSFQSETSDGVCSIDIKDQVKNHGPYEIIVKAGDKKVTKIWDNGRK